MALSAMDKLLKSNELVIQMLAVLPALIIATASGVVGLRFLRRRTRTSFFQSAEDLRHRFLEMARSVYAAGSEKLSEAQRLQAEGHLIAVCHDMSHAIRTAIFLSGGDKKQLIADLEELLIAGAVASADPMDVRATSERRHHILSIVRLALDTHASSTALW